ncbi:hypothetical protein [Domibacillus robiginosus]|nr:hypothetical protein [Domibacillus robiginosus]
MSQNTGINVTEGQIQVFTVALSRWTIVKGRRPTYNTLLLFPLDLIDFYL